jgi:hypothetical protein
METALKPDNEKVITLVEAAEILKVPVNTLLKWNEYNILKPTITNTGDVGYKQEQIDQFLIIRQQFTNRQNFQVRRDKIKTRDETFPVVKFLSITAITALITVTIITRQEWFKSVATKEDTMRQARFIQTKRSDFYKPVDSTLPPENSYNLATISANMDAYAQSESPVSGQEIANPIFDKDGNIKGEIADTGVLATNSIAQGSIHGSSIAKQTVDLNLLLVIAALALLSIPLFFKKQPAYQAVVPGSISEILPIAVDNNLEEHKILEVNQKTDGSVVLCFRGQEYKVSKPELDSESDQFIEKLMSLAGSDIKEINYDAGEDSEINLSAPLSKLVTRLGFVGMKRDLFFPRTSKNKVLFRRFVTQNDLSSMNLSPEEIFREILSGN